jgi:hypothetical protein
MIAPMARRARMIRLSVRLMRVSVQSRLRWQLFTATVFSVVVVAGVEDEDGDGVADSLMGFFGLTGKC